MSKDPKKSILLVEDEILIALAEKSELESWGYKVATVNTGEKAVDFMKNDPGIELILMDIDLGKGMDGTKAAEIILGNRDIPILFLSSHIDREVVEKTEKITSYGYVVKDSSITVLDASIKMAFKLFDEKRKSKAINDKLEATLNALPDALFEVDLEGYQLHVHTPDTSILYKPEKVLIGKRISDVLPPEVSAIVMAAIHEANEKGFSLGKQYQMQVPHGLSWFELSVSRIASISGSPHFIILRRDITDRNKIIEAQRLSESRYRRIQSISHIGSWEYHIGKNTFWGSEEAKRIFELDIRDDDFSVDLVMECVVERDRVNQALLDLIERNMPCDIEFDIITHISKERKRIHTIAELERDKSGNPILVSGVVIDISAQKST